MVKMEEEHNIAVPIDNLQIDFCVEFLQEMVTDYREFVSEFRAAKDRSTQRMNLSSAMNKLSYIERFAREHYEELKPYRKALRDE